MCDVLDARTHTRCVTRFLFSSLFALRLPAPLSLAHLPSLTTVQNVAYPPSSEARARVERSRTRVPQHDALTNFPVKFPETLRRSKRRRVDSNSRERLSKCVLNLALLSQHKDGGGRCACAQSRLRR